MLTLPGETQAARVAASLLLAVGLPHLIVRSTREFEQMTVGLAAGEGDVARRGRLGGPSRTELRERLKTS